MQELFFLVKKTLPPKGACALFLYLPHKYSAPCILSFFCTPGRMSRANVCLYIVDNKLHLQLSILMASSQVFFRDIQKDCPQAGPWHHDCQNAKAREPDCAYAQAQFERTVADSPRTITPGKTDRATGARPCRAPRSVRAIFCGRRARHASAAAATSTY